MESTEIKDASAPFADFFRRKRLALLLLLFRLILGGIFLYSGGTKLLDPGAFQNEIANFDLVSWKFAGIIALYLPWLEIVCGIAVITSKQLRGGLAILSILMIVFIVVVGSAWFRGLDVTCGCFGASENAISYPRLIARNLAILAGLVLTFFIDTKRNGRAVEKSPVD